MSPHVHPVDFHAARPEGPLEQIHCSRFGIRERVASKALLAAADQPQLAHDVGNPLATHMEALPAQLGVHPGPAVNTAGGGVDLGDALTQGLVVELAAAGLVVLPVIEGGPGDL
jgi:hypothetical protein